MQVIKTLIVAAAVVGVSAQDKITAATDQSASLTADQVEAGLEMMPVTTNAQSQTCSTLPFRAASSMMYQPGYKLTDDQVKNGEVLAPLIGHFKDPLDLFYPNVKWEPVHHSLWSFDDKAKDATNPLGFRQAAFKDNTPICLHMSSTTARHKLELMVDFMAGSKICVEDIRTAHMNPNVELIRSCDSKGKINRCFSALDGKYASSRSDTKLKLKEGDTNYAEQPADFAVAIGCFDGGCRDDYSTSRLYYRVRQSVKSWTDSQGGAGEGLDYWCMSLAAINPTYGIFRDTFTAEQINTVPQMYPSDMWASVVRTRSGDDNYADATVYNKPQNSGAAAVSAGIATVAFAVLSLMF